MIKKQAWLEKGVRIDNGKNFLLAQRCCGISRLHEWVVGMGRESLRTGWGVGGRGILHPCPSFR